MSHVKVKQAAHGQEAAVRRWKVEAAALRQAPFPGGPAVRVVVGTNAAGAVGVVEVTLPVGGAMPEHEHGDSAVLLVPLGGHLRLVEAGREGAAIELEPGVLATIPVGRRVRLENAGQTEARTLAVLTPGDFAGRLEAWPAAEADARSESDTLASALEREHREIDRAIEEFLATGGSGTTRMEPLTAAMQALRRHIFLEEEFLFPPLRDAGFVAPVFVMMREHGELWRTMESIERDLTGAGTGSDVAGWCRALLAQLDRHNAKEEPMLYPNAESVLGAPASAELHAFLADGRMPDGWACAKA